MKRPIFHFFMSGQSAPRSARKAIRLLPVIALSAIGTVSGLAASITWDGGGGDTNWSTAGNWGGATPANNDALTFSGVTGLSNSNNLLGSVGAVTFTTGGFRISGNALTLNGDFTNDGTNFWDINSTLGADRIFTSNSGTLTLNGWIDNAGFLMTFAGFGNTRISGIVGGTGGIATSGNLTLENANTYTGATSIAPGGTLCISQDLNLGTVPGSATVGSLIIDSTGTLATTVSFTLNSNRGIKIGPTSGIGAGIVDVASDTTLTYGGIITSNGAASTGGLTKAGAGTLKLSGANTYTGTTSIHAGILQLGGATAIPSGIGKGDVVVDATLDLNGKSVTVNGLSSVGSSGKITSSVTGAITFTAGGNNGSGIYSGTIQDGSGQIAFNKIGTGTITLAGSNSFTGGIVIGAGTLRLGHAGALNSTVPNSVSFGASAPATTKLQLNGNSVTIASLATASTPGSVVVENANSLAATLTIHQSVDTLFAGVLQDGSGGGALAVIKSDSGSLSLSGANTFSGAATVNQGTLILAGGAAVSDTTAVVLANSAGVSLQLNASETIGSLAGGGTSGGNLNLQAFTLTTGGANSSTTFAGVISGAGALVKTGSGAMTLSRASSYGGTTAIKGGSIQLGIDNALPATTALTLGDGATNANGLLDLNNYSQTLAGLNTAGTGTSNRIINPGAIARTLTLDIASSFSFSGILGGATAADSNFSLAKTGSGTMTLSGTNTYTGTTAIGAGTLSVGNLATNLGNATSPLIFSGGALSYTGTSTTFTRGLTINAGGGQIDIAAGQTLTLATGNVAAAGPFTVGGSGNTLITSNITGAGSLNKTGSGTLTLSGGNTYTGATNLRAGTITLGVANALNPTGTLTLGDATLNTSGTLKLNGFSQSFANLAITGTGTANRITGGSSTLSTLTISNSFSFGGIFGGPGTNDNNLALVKSGAGTLTLSGNNTFTGGTTISAGALAVGSAANLGASSSQIVIQTATLQFTSSFSWAQTINFSQAASTLSVGSGLTSTHTGVLSGDGALNLTGSGTLTVGGTSDTYTGGTNLLNGTLQLGANNALPTGTVVTLGSGTTNGTLVLNGYSQTIAGLATSGSGTNRVVSRRSSGGTLTINSSSDATYAGILGGTATNENIFGLTKAGAGMLTLSGSNTFTGALMVSTGTLALSGGAAVADTVAVTLANEASAVLRLNANETIGSLAGGGLSGGSVDLTTRTLTAGGNNSTTTFSGVISGEGGFTKQGTGTLTLSGSNTYTGTTTISAGTLVLSGGAAIADAGGVSLGTTSGTLQLNASETIGSLAGGGPTGGNVNLQSNTLTVGENNANTTYGGTISGAGGITKIGGGELKLSRANTYAGATTISSGTLIYGTNNALPSGTSLAIDSSGTLDINGRTGTNATINGLTGSGTVTNNSAGTAGVITIGNNIAPSTFNGSLTNGTGTLALTKTGTGTLTLTPGTDNAFTGGITINAGILQAGNGNAFNSAGSNVITFGSDVASGTKLQINGNSVTIAGLVTNNTVGSPVVENANAAAATLTINNSGTHTYAGVIQDGTDSGAFSLVKSGTGTQILSGTNTYTGSTSIQGGILSISTDANLGTAPVGATAGSLLIGGGTLKFTNTVDITLSANRGIALGASSGTGSGTVEIVSTAGTVRMVTYAGMIANNGSGTGQLIKTGLGNLALSGTSNTYSGGTSISAGLVSVTSSGAGALGADESGNSVSVSAGGNLSLSSISNKGSNQTITVTSDANGRGGIGFSQTSLTQGDLAGLFTNNTGSYGGVLSINSGITYDTAIDLASFGSDDNAGLWFLGSASSGTYSSSTLTVGAGNTYRLGGGGGSLSLSAANVLTGANSVLVGFGGNNGNGVVTLNANQNYTGTTTITGGAVLAVSADARLGSGSGSGNIVLDGGVLRATANFTLVSARGIALGAASGSGSGTIDVNLGRTLTYGGVIEDNGNDADSFVKTGSGTLILTADSMNTFTGSASINGGTLQFSRIENLGAAGTAVNFSRGTLRYATDNTVDITTRAVTTISGATIDTNGNDVIFGTSAITGAGSFAKSGAGTLTLDVANTYTGATTITAGIVKLGHVSAIPSGVGYGALTVTGILDLNNLSPTVNRLTGAGIITNSKTGTSTLTVDSGGSNSTSTFSGTITDGSGTVSLTKIGANTLTLSGTSSTYSGGTRVSGGILSVTNDRALGAVPDIAVTNIIIAGGATLGSSTNSFEINANRGIAIDGSTAASLAVAAGTTLTYNGAISNTGGTTGGLTKTNTTGALVLGGSNTYSGDTTISGGTLKIVGTSAIPWGTGKGNVSIASSNSGQLDLNGNSITINGLTGAGMVRSNTAGAASITVGGNDATSTFTGTILNGNASSVVSLSKIGTGTLTLSGTNSYTGGTSIAGGVLSIGADANLGTVPGTTSPASLVINGGTLATTASFTLHANRGLVIGPTTGSGSGTLSPANGTSLVVGGVITDNDNGTGGLVKANTTGTLTLAGANTYSGDTTVSGGTLQLGNAAALPSGTGKGNLSLNSGTTMDLNGFTQTVNGLSGAGTVTNSATGVVTFTAGANNAGGSFGGVIQDGNGTVSFTKTGTGTLTLTAASTYSGHTTIHAGGTLEVAHASALPSGLNKGNVIADGTLAVATSLTVNGLSGSGLLTNNSAGAVVLTAGSNDQSSVFAGTIANGMAGGSIGLTKTGTGTLTLSGNNTFSGATTISTGTLAMGSATGLSDASTLTIAAAGTLDVNGFSVTMDGLAGTGTITNHGATSAVLTSGASGASTTFGGTIMDGSSALSLLKSGSGTLTLTGVNGYSGTTTIADGTLSVANPGESGAIGTGSGPVILGSATTAGTLSYTTNADLTFTRGFAVNAGGGSMDITSSGRTLTLDGGGVSTVGTFAIGGAGAAVINSVISGSGGFTKANTGITVINSANTYTGNTAVSVGTLKVNHLSAIPTGAATGDFAIAGGAVLDVNNLSLTLNGLSGAGTITNSQGSAVTLSVGDNNGTGEFTGIIEDGSGGGTTTLAKIGAGTITLGGSNTYSGHTTVAAGTLKFGIASAIPSGSSKGNVALEADGALDLNDFDASINGLSGSGLVTNNAGDSTLSVGNNNQTGVFSGNIRDGLGTIGITKTGTGMLTLSGDNTFSGATTIAQGTLSMGSDTGLSSASTLTIGNTGALDLNGRVIAIDGLAGTGSITNNSATDVILKIGSSGGWGTFGGTINDGAGMIGLVKAGGGTVTLSQVNSYSGHTTVTGGLLAITSYGALGAVPASVEPANIVLNGGGISASNTFEINSNRGIAVGPATGSGGGMLDAAEGQTLTYNGIIANNGSGTGGLTKTGLGTVTLGGINTYSGDTTVAVGSLQIGNSLAIPSGAGKGNLALNATLDLKNTSITVNGLSGTGIVDNTEPGTATLNVGANDQTSTFDGVIKNGNGITALAKVGAGTLTLTGTSTYTGATLVSQGTLMVNGTLANTTTNVSSGAILGGTGTLGGATTIESGGTHAPGNVGTPGKQTFTTGITYNSGSIFEWSLNASDSEEFTPELGTYDKVVTPSAVAGSTNSEAIFKVVLGTNHFSDAFWDTNRTWTDIFSGGGTYTLASLLPVFGGTDGTNTVSANGVVAGQGSFYYTGSSLNWSAVPEPTSALVGMLLGAGLLRRRRTGKH